MQPKTSPSLFILVLVCLAITAGCSTEYRKPLARTSTVAGLGKEFGETFGVAVKDGAIYVSDGEKGEIRVVKDGKTSVFASGLNTPSGLAFTPDGTLLVADAGSNTIRAVSPTGEISSFAGVEGRMGNVDIDSPFATFRGPIGLAVSSDGRVFVADTYNDSIRLISDGKVSTLAGGAHRGHADLAGTEASFDTPTGLAAWGDKLLVADTGNRRIRVIERDGQVWTLAGTDGEDPKDGSLNEAVFLEPTAIAVREGEIFIADGNAIRVISGIVPIVRTLNKGDRGFADGDTRNARFNRPSGLALDGDNLIVADAENRVVRIIGPDAGHETTKEEAAALDEHPQDFRSQQPPRWPYDPPSAVRDIAGTLGELRGDIRPNDDEYHFHNGLDIAGAYGETARFVRSEKVLRSLSTQNFGTLRELVRMPTMGYIHIRLGRDQDNKPFNDPRFLFDGVDGHLNDVRIPRGSFFKAGEPIGTLNKMNHVHLIAGRSGSEMNALDALELPGISDTRKPVIESVDITNENFDIVDTQKPVSGKLRVVMRAYDQVDGNIDRRRLGIYKAGYQLFRDGAPFSDEVVTIRFDRLPPEFAVPYVYAIGSHSGATGETIFRYIVTNSVEANNVSQGFVDTSALQNGRYEVRVFAGDKFGNRTYRSLTFEVAR